MLDSSTTTDDVISTFGDGVLTLTLNRPDRRNALSRSVTNAMHEVLSEAVGDRSVRAVVLRGAGGIFSAGGDLKDFGNLAADGDPDPAAVARMNREFGDVLELLLQTGAVVVAVVEKAAVGGGFGLAAVADVVIADSSARFAMTETSLGLVPAQIAPVVARRLGVVQANRLAVTARWIGAHEAAELGLVDRIAEDVDIALAEVLQDVRRCAPGAVAATKQLMRDLSAHPLGDVLDRASELFAEAILGTEAREGIDAFLQKQLPPWASTAPEQG